MSFLSDNKLLFSAVGIALSSAAVGYVVGHYIVKKRSDAKGTLGKCLASARYVLELGMREPLPLKRLREVRVCISVTRFRNHKALNLRLQNTRPF